MEEVDEEDWNLDGVVTAAEADKSDLRGKLHELQTAFLAVHIEIFAGLVDVVQMTEHSVTLEEQLRNSDRELQVASGAG